MTPSFSMLSMAESTNLCSREAEWSLLLSLCWREPRRSRRQSGVRWAVHSSADPAVLCAGACFNGWREHWSFLVPAAGFSEAAQKQRCWAVQVQHTAHTSGRWPSLKQADHLSSQVSWHGLLTSYATRFLAGCSCSSSCHSRRRRSI